VVPRNGEHGRAEGAEELRRKPVLLGAPSVRQIARGDDQFGLHRLDERRQGTGDFGILACTPVKIGYMEEACRHDRMRL
jgi:hypothetical protein